MYPLESTAPQQPLRLANPGDLPTGESAVQKTAVERIWHIEDIQGQVLALTFRLKSVTRFKVFPLRSKAGAAPISRIQHRFFVNNLIPKHFRHMNLHPGKLHTKAHNAPDASEEAEVLTRWTTKVSSPQIFGGNVTKRVPHKALMLIA